MFKIKRHIISILVENQSGVLSRITGLFSRRGFNIDSLSVGETEDKHFSRITIVTTGDDSIVAQISKQVEKLVDVVKAVELMEDASVFRELALIKVNASKDMRPEIVAMADIFRANIIDVSKQSMSMELTGDQSKINAFLELLSGYGIAEIARTGLTGLQRGYNIIKDNIEEDI